MRLQDYQDVAAAGDMPTLQTRVVRFAHELGFGIISGSLVVEQGSDPAAIFHFGNTPAAYQSTFLSTSIGQRDPVLRRLKRLSAPFAYDQATYVREQAADLWDTQALFGYKTASRSPCTFRAASTFYWASIETSRFPPTKWCSLE